VELNHTQDLSDYSVALAAANQPTKIDGAKMQSSEETRTSVIFLNNVSEQFFCQVAVVNSWGKFLVVFDPREAHDIL